MLLLLLVKYALLSLHMLLLLELQMLQISCSDIFCQKGGEKVTAKDNDEKAFFVQGIIFAEAARRFSLVRRLIMRLSHAASFWVPPP